ncbi:MAG: hypothetical protein PHT60_02255 [Acidiphilium sp.]|nr:hypothetical protein [Acidiphilium sp.]MDD4934578.1 hypothetical protein [Acidiphilium sp.]
MNDPIVMIGGNRVQRYTAPANALPLTDWSKAMLKGQIINMQTGPIRLSVHYDRENVWQENVWQENVWQENIWSGLAFDHKNHISDKPVIG